jgi:hypothetical protein
MTKSEVRDMAIMDKKEFNRLVDEDFPDPGPITDKVREITQKESGRFRGSVRLSLGRFWTDKEYEEYRKKVLNTPLP